MGIRDFFNRFRNRKENKQKVNKSNQEKMQYPQMSLKYSDGTIADITFMGVVDYQLENGKSSHLQEVYVTYTDPDNKSLKGKSFYIDPIAITDEQGNYVYNSAKYFEELKRNNVGLAKAFFKKQNVVDLPSNYLGSLAIYNDGRKPSRKFNQTNGFYTDYIEHYKAKEQEKIRIQQEKSREADKAFEKELRESVNEKGVDYKYSSQEDYEQHSAQKLTLEDLAEMNRKREEYYKNYR